MYVHSEAWQAALDPHGLFCPASRHLLAGLRTRLYRQKTTPGTSCRARRARSHAPYTVSAQRQWELPLVIAKTIEDAKTVPAIAHDGFCLINALGFGEECGRTLQGMGWRHLQGGKRTVFEEKTPVPPLGWVEAHNGACGVDALRHDIEERTEAPPQSDKPLIAVPGIEIGLYEGMPAT
jgi:hypothetical protein